MCLSHTHRLPATIKIEENAASPWSPLGAAFESTIAQESSTATTPTTLAQLARTSGTASTNVEGDHTSTGGGNQSSVIETVQLTRAAGTRADPSTVEATTNTFTVDVTETETRETSTIESNSDEPETSLESGHGSENENTPPKNKASAYAAFILLATFVLLIIICLVIKGRSAKKRRQLEHPDETKSLKGKQSAQESSGDETHSKLLNPYQPTTNAV